MPLLPLGSVAGGVSDDESLPPPLLPVFNGTPGSVGVRFKVTSVDLATVVIGKIPVTCASVLIGKALTICTTLVGAT